jgi:hypothetical protein
LRKYLADAGNSQTQRLHAPETPSTFIDLNRLRRGRGAGNRVQAVRGHAAALKAQQWSTSPQPKQGLLVNSDAGNGMVGNERPVLAEIHEFPLSAVELKLGMKTRPTDPESPPASVGAANANSPRVSKSQV